MTYPIVYNCLHRLFSTNITACGETVKEIEMKLNSELENVHKWLLANKLTLNLNITEYMIIGSRQRLAKITDDVKIDFRR